MQNLPLFFKEALEQGFFILKQKGVFNNSKLIAYSLVKNDDDKSLTVKCYLNKAAYNLLKPSFEIKEEKNIRWCNHHDFMGFSTQSEPKMITWSNTPVSITSTL